MISKKLGTIHCAHFNIKATSKKQFFRENYYKNKNMQMSSFNHNNRVLHSFQVMYNTDMYHKGGLVWRILEKFKKNEKKINPTFRQACKFKAYAEIWKYHSTLIEKLIVNYDELKWFFEKEKRMSEEVFTEFLECKKLQDDIRGELTFAQKVFLAFDENG